jgi:microsomal dipeptidase-like Zn-dependent dipeptidase
MHRIKMHFPGCRNPVIVARAATAETPVCRIFARSREMRRWLTICVGMTLGCLFGILVLAEPSVEARSAPAAEQSACGGQNQRACCVFEASFGACQAGLTEVAGCSGSCTCGGFNPFGIQSSGTCRLINCGGEGQRACQPFEKFGFQACADGLAEIPGCSGDCTATSGATVSGTCTRPTPCGGEGQRACIVFERAGGSCDAGLTAIPGCSGDCFGKGVGSAWGRSTHTCVKLPLEPIAEPTTNAFPAGQTCSMAGYADIHLHLFADLAHGGGVLGGQPYDYGSGGGVNEALGQDFTTHKTLEPKNGVGTVPAPTLCDQNLLGAANCGRTSFHLDHDILAGDTLGAGTGDGARSPFGAPVFNGWPKWTSTTHQQTYYTWLKRAWQGGLRLVTMLAVTNEALCRGSRRVPGVDCEDSMAAIVEQIQAARDFEEWIALNDGGWFQIVETPLEARKAIARGRLAVVLGVETAELFNCKFPISQCTLYPVPVLGQLSVIDDGHLNTCTFDESTNGRSAPLPNCTPGYIAEQVEALYDMGVRHVFPVHNFDNAFGAAASWNSTIEIGQRVVEDHWWKTRDCSDDGYGFNMRDVLMLSRQLVGLIGFGEAFQPPVHLWDAACNEYGLFPLGRVLMQELMARGMIIDVDHLSARAFNDTLDMAEQPSVHGVPGRTTPYPVVASHVLKADVHDTAHVHERMRTNAQLDRIRNVGGMVAAMLKDEVQDTDDRGKRVTRTTTSDAHGFVDNCRHSSKSFALAYIELSQRMNAPVALGSDFNGTAGHFGPRFGSSACGGPPEAGFADDQEIFPIEVPDRQKERSAQYRAGNRVLYPFTVPGFGTFHRQVTGKKVFDYNVDGLAHVGLLPDFVEDLKKIGMPQAHLDRLFNSAEEYIRVWERATGDAEPEDICTLILEPLTVRAEVSPQANEHGWNNTDVSVVWHVGGGEGSVTKTGCTNATLTSETFGTTLTCTATDSIGQKVQESVMIRIDKTPPDALALRETAANEHGWNNTDVIVAAVAKDGMSGVDGPLLQQTTVSAEGIHSRSFTFTDRAGNSRTVTIDDIRIDKTPPIAFADRTPANGHGWNQTDVIVEFSAFDWTSGLIGENVVGVVVSDEGAGQSRSRTFTDLAGNSTTVTVGDINIDKTPPTITGAPDRTANAHNWYKADVTVTYVCDDGLSGVASCAPAETLSAEAAGQSATGLVTDKAGNTASVTVGDINIDKTAPTIVASPDRPANEHGWYNAAVTVSYACADTLSGVLTCADPETISGEGGSQAATGVVSDRAGNTAQATLSGVNIDMTPPVVTCVNDSPTLWPPNGRLIGVTATVGVDGGTSGANGFTLLSATSNQADNGNGDGNTTGDIRGWVIGTPSAFGFLRAERAGPLTARVYSLLYEGRDKAGNAATCTTTVTVPHDQRGR